MLLRQGVLARSIGRRPARLVPRQDVVIYGADDYRAVQLRCEHLRCGILQNQFEEPVVNLLVVGDIRLELDFVDWSCSRSEVQEDKAQATPDPLSVQDNEALQATSSLSPRGEPRALRHWRSKLGRSQELYTFVQVACP